jgi:hypothetical protein
MPSSSRPSLGELPHRLRAGIETLPGRWSAWRAAVRDDPAVLWRGPVARGLALIIGGALLIGAASWLSGALVPPKSADEQRPPTSTLYVACTNPGCGAAQTVERPLDFKAWPLKCQRCGQATVYRARQCPTCRAWFAVPPNSAPACPKCAAAQAAAAKAEPNQPKKRGPNDEDPW